MICLSAMGDLPENDEKDDARSRGVAALVVGFIGCMLIWWITPFNNFVIGSSYIADSYLPVIALFITIILVLGVNPLMRCLAPRLALGRRQMAVILGMMLVGCYLPGSGLHRMLPYSLARITTTVAASAPLAEIYDRIDLPPSLFPDRLGLDEATDVSNSFLDELAPGESIPWRAWAGPTVSWGLFMLCCSMMTVGLAMVVLPQWRENERLPFPLLTVQQALIETPDEGRAFAPLFRRPSFWVAAGAVFMLHFMAGAHTYYPGGVPAIPLQWDLSSLFTEGLFRYTPGFIRYSRIYFIFLGVAFFMPNRIGFSVWFFQCAYAVYQMVGQAYAPPFYGDTISDHRTGAMLSLTVGILWVGRSHWARVGRSLFRKPADDAARRDRKSAYVLLLGGAGMFGWLVWAGVQPLAAAFFVGVAFVVCLLVTRMVAETGLPMIGLYSYSLIYLIRLVPAKLISGATFFFACVVTMLFDSGSRMCCATLAVHGLGMDGKAGPRRQARLGLVFIGILAVGFLVSGAFHLRASYGHSATLDGREQPISEWGCNRLIQANQDLMELNSGRLRQPPYNQLKHVAVGAALAGLLQWGCLSMPGFILHPIGMLGVYTWYFDMATASIFLGWMLKLLILRYGGSRLYRNARPVFIGLIMGEVFAAIFWGLVLPASLVFLNLPYKNVQILPY